MLEIQHQTNDCKLCGRVCENGEKLANSHIIPNSFFKKYQGEKKPAIILSNTKGEFPKRSPNGIYDPTILCLNCESKYFQEVDDYGACILLNDTSSYFSDEISVTGHRFIQSEKVDQILLFRFFISVLWRASVSKDNFFNRVKLGPYEKVAAEVILHPELEVPATFGVVLSIWGGLADADNGIMMDPFREKWNGANAYRFYFGRFVAYIKVDRLDFSGVLAGKGLNQSSQLVVIERDIFQSKDGFAMKQTAIEALRNKERNIKRR